MKILLLDNYDSFTYNLLHIVKELGAQIEVRRNDQITLDEVERFDKILLSPGPGIPEEVGILLPLIRRYAPTKSILGVCLGEQAIGEAFGAKLVNLTEVYHGISSDIQIVADDCLAGAVSRLSGGDGCRYGKALHHGIAPPYLRRARHSVSSRIGAYAGREENDSKLDVK